MHDVDDEDGDVAEAGAARPQVCEGLVPRRVDDEQPGNAGRGEWPAVTIGSVCLFFIHNVWCI